MSTASNELPSPTRQRYHHTHSNSNFVNGGAATLNALGYGGIDRQTMGDNTYPHGGWDAYDEKADMQSWPASSTIPNGLGWTGDEQQTRWLPSFSSLHDLRKKLPSFNIDPSLARSTIPAPFLDLSPATLQFCLLCCLWYSSSALSSNTGKAILTQFRYPVTLTFVQFGFVASYCLIFTSPLVRYTRLRKPNKAILQSTLPMGLFQVGGHMFSSMAISRIPVSTVHTIKALSPLFTVAAYAMLFSVRYSTQTYISLLPLTLGVMLACSFDVSASNALGLICAFGSAIVFVSSNIFFKKIMPTGGSGSTSHKLDKLNLLFYSSSMAFLLMIPMWLYYDLPALLAPSDVISHPSHGHSSPHGVLYYFFLNGTVHFAQNIIAFIILSSTSPVTYSIASLIKRVVVICIAIVWFSQSVHPIQGFGICMTFVGLWMYNNAKTSVDKGETKMRRVEAMRDMALPTVKTDVDSPSVLSPSPLAPGPIDTSFSIHGRPIHSRINIGKPASIPTPLAPPMHHNYEHKHLHGPNTINAPALKIVTPPYELHRGQFVQSPTDSYPSPPPSRDSPPLTAAFTASFQQSFQPEALAVNHRRGTISHGDNSQLDHINSNFMQKVTPVYAVA